MKRIVCFLLTTIFVISMFIPFALEAHAEESALSLSKSSVVIGDAVTVTITIPDGTNAEVDLQYPADLLQYESADQEVGVPIEGVIPIVMGKYIGSSNTITLTFKAKTTGEGTITSLVTKAYKDDMTLIDMKGKSAKITVENKSAEVNKSDDNSLQYIKLSSGTLTPSFVYNVTSYTATVDYSVTSLVVDAKTSNAKATIESVTGNENLQVGENTIKIVVVAENGTKATYKIVVTRLEKSTGGNEGGNEDGNEGGENTPEPEQEGVKFSYGNQELISQEKIPAEIIPADFETTTKVISGKEIDVLQFIDGELIVLYLENAEGYGGLYVYDEEEKDVYPFIKLEAEYSYVVVLRPSADMTMDGYKQCTLSLEGKGTIIAFQKEKRIESGEKDSFWKNLFNPMICNAAEAKEEEFYLLYCMNHNGEYGWYSYDAVEQTFQRYLTVQGTLIEGVENEDEEENAQHLAAMNSQLQKSQKKMQLIVYALAGAIAVLLVALIVVTILGLKSTRIEEEEEEEEFGADELKNSPYGELKQDDFDVDVFINDTFPEEEEAYEDEDLEMVDL